jgi:lysophospholipid acyltransferase (LPLAT)-like uncharacterized protein
VNKVRGIILGFIVWIIYKIISSTWRVKISEPPQMRQELDQKKGIILAHFHGDEIALISLARIYKIATMTSTSKDGQIMNTTLNLLGAKTSRGSSTRGGIGALKGLIRLCKEGRSASFAVDGPKGPLHEIKPGVFEFSRLTGANIYTCGVSCDRAWHFPRSWNKTYFPKPFAKLNVVWSGPIPSIDKGLDPRSPELAKALQNQLFDARRNAANFIADRPPQT